MQKPIMISLERMSPFLLVLSFLLSSFLPEKLVAQDQHKIDSIRNELKKQLTQNRNASLADSEIVNLYGALSSVYMPAVTDSVIFYATKAHDLAMAINYKEGIIRSLNGLFSGYQLSQNNIKMLAVTHELVKQARIDDNQKSLCSALNKTGYANYRLGNTDSAFYYYQQSLKLALAINDTNMISRSYGGFALVYETKAIYDSAIVNYKKQMVYLIALRDTQSQAVVLLDIGLAYRNSNPSLALDYFFRAQKLAEFKKNDFYVACIMHSIGSIYAGQKKNDEALKYFNDALAKFHKTRSIDFASNCLASIGSIYNSEFHEYEKALDYYNRAMAGYDSAGNTLAVAITQMNIGNVLALQKKYNEAISNYELAQIKLKEAGDNYNYTICLLNVGQAYYGLGNNSLALNQANTALVLAKELGFITERKNIHELLSNIYERMKDYKAAFENAKLFKRFSDSIYNTSNTQKITELQMQYDFDKQQTEEKAEQDKIDAVASAELDKQKTQKYAFIGGLIFVLLLAALLFNRYRTKIKANHLLEEKNTQIESEKARAEKSQLRAEKSEKFKEQFLANMSHEIRTPMNAIVGMTNLVLNSKLNEQQHTYMDAIKKSSHNLLVIINDILDLSKIEAGKMEFEKINFKLQDVLDQVYSTLRFKAEEKSLKLMIETDEQVPSIIVGDPVRLNQILLNLAGNAIKFTQKGSVTIQVKNQDAGDRTETNCNLLFTVTDTGIGIPEEKVDSIFESFNQADRDTFRKYGGTGLGLGISKYLVDMQGGSIAVKSKQGEGSSFTFLIPYQIGNEEGLQSEIKTIDELQRSKLSNLRILLAEDNYFNQIVLVDTLRVLLPGITVEVAVNGKEAIEKLKSQHFDLVLMDVHMPEMNGLEAIHIIRETLIPPLNKIKVIALTASVTKAEISKCYEAGMDDYLPKPFEQEELVNKIAKLTLN